nr:helix-turn-helix domain-containing protein [Methylobacterium sp. ZNC0032]
MKQADDQQLTEAEACKRLAISRETMRKRRLAGQIARCKGLKAVRYWRSEVDRHGSDPEALSPEAGPAPCMPPVVSPVASQDQWARCVAECRRRGIDPSDRIAVSAVMNQIYAEDEREAAWDAIEAKGSLS